MDDSTYSKCENVPVQGLDHCKAGLLDRANDKRRKSRLSTHPTIR